MQEASPKSVPRSRKITAGVVLAGVLLAGCHAKADSAEAHWTTPSATASAPPATEASPSGQPGNVPEAGGKGDGAPLGSVACKGYKWHLLSTGTFAQVEPKIELSDPNAEDFYVVGVLWPSADAARAANTPGSTLGGVVSIKGGNIIQTPVNHTIQAAAVSVVDFSNLPAGQRPTHSWEVSIPLDPKFQGATISPCNQDGSNIIDFAVSSDEYNGG